jgi:hypothetical protein
MSKSHVRGSPCTLRHFANGPASRIVSQDTFKQLKQWQQCKYCKVWMNQKNKEYRMTSKCMCGSGLPRQAQYDARNIFLTYTCQKCHDEKMRKYRADVLTDPNYWHDEPIDEEC